MSTSMTSARKSTGRRSLGPIWMALLSKIVVPQNCGFTNKKHTKIVERSYESKLLPSSMPYVQITPKLMFGLV